MRNGFLVGFAHTHTQTGQTQDVQDSCNRSMFTCQPLGGTSIQKTWNGKNTNHEQTFNHVAVFTNTVHVQLLRVSLFASKQLFFFFFCVP
jgi:hypothetical protein